MTNETSNKVKRFIISWDVRFPIDRWWRQKHNVPFNSLTHRESNFIDMYTEFVEDRMVEEMLKEEVYIPGTGNFLKERKISQEQYLADMSKIDLSQFDDPQ